MGSPSSKLLDQGKGGLAAGGSTPHAGAQFYERTSTAMEYAGAFALGKGMSEINASRVTSQSIRCDSEKVLCVSVADEFMPASVLVNGVKFKPESDEPEILPAQIGEFVIDSLESAIRDTVSLIGDEHERLGAAGKDASNVLIYLDGHLKTLLAIQLDRLSPVSERVCKDAQPLFGSGLKVSLNRPMP